MRPLFLLALGLTSHSERHGTVGELRIEAHIKSGVEMTVTDHGPSLLAEVQCRHTGLPCDRAPVVAWSNEPTMFTFNGETLEGLKAQTHLLASD